jgi:hypothetical protein
MSRPHVELAHVPEIAPAPFHTDGWPVGATIRLLSSDPESGARTGIVTIPTGWQRLSGSVTGASELLVLEGSLRVGETLRGVGYYEYAAAGARQPRWRCDTGCVMLAMFRGAPDFAASSGPPSDERITLDTNTLPWEGSMMPGHPAGVVMKFLRRDEETGEMVLLESIVPRWEYDVVEYHACAEELYLIDGDMWLANSGTMLPGSYLWRPAYLTHGPFYTHSGSVILAWLESDVQSHHVDDPRRTADENRAEDATRLADRRSEP